MDLSNTPPDYNPFADPPEPATQLPEGAATPAPPARTGVPLLGFGLVCGVAAILVGWLLIRAGHLQAEVDALRAQAEAAQSQAALVGDLRAKVDQLTAETVEYEQFRTALMQAEGLRIISATYGSGGKVAEVTPRVKAILQATNAEFYAHPDSLGADPTPGWNKQLVIIYEFQGRRHTFTTGEGGRVTAAELREAAGPW